MPDNDIIGKEYPTLKRDIREIQYSAVAFSSRENYSFYPLQPIEDSKLVAPFCFGVGDSSRIQYDFLTAQHSTFSVRLIHQKEREITLLNRKIGEMQNRIDLLEQKIGSAPVIGVENFVELSDEKMRQIIIDYYKTHKIVYPSDIAFAMNFDLRQVVKIVNELLTSGEIEEAI